MRLTKHSKGNQRPKVYYGKFCDEKKGGCGDWFKPTSRTDICNKCQKENAKKRYLKKYGEKRVSKNLL